MSSLMSEENISQTSNVCPATLLFLLDHHTCMRSSSGTLKGSHPEVGEFSQPIEDPCHISINELDKKSPNLEFQVICCPRGPQKQAANWRRQDLFSLNQQHIFKKTLFLFKTLRYVRKWRIWSQGMFDTMLQLWLKCIGLISCRLWCHVVSC